MDKIETAPEGASVSERIFEEPIADLIDLTKSIQAIESELAEKAEPHDEMIARLQELKKKDLAELEGRRDELKEALAAVKEHLGNNWPSEEKRIEHDGWKVDRKEKKSAEVLDEPGLAAKMIAVLDWEKAPFKLSWNKTALAKLIEAGAVPEELARPTVNIGISLTPPKDPGA